MGSGDFDDGFYMNDEPILDTRFISDDWQFEDLKLLMVDVLKRLERLEKQQQPMPFPFTPGN
jgi:hypothetical protein